MQQPIFECWELVEISVEDQRKREEMAVFRLAGEKAAEALWPSHQTAASYERGHMRIEMSEKFGPLGAPIKAPEPPKPVPATDWFAKGNHTVNGIVMPVAKPKHQMTMQDMRNLNQEWMASVQRNYYENLHASFVSRYARSVKPQVIIGTNSFFFHDER